MFKAFITRTGKMVAAGLPLTIEAEVRGNTQGETITEWQRDLKRSPYVSYRNVKASHREIFSF